MKFIFVDNETEGGRVWIVEAPDKHNAIATAVKEGYSEDMKDFYYGFEDGQISIYTIEKEIGPDEPPTPARAADAEPLEYDPAYMLSQIERLTWEGHVLRRALIVSGADMDKIDTGNEAWMAHKEEAS